MDKDKKHNNEIRAAAKASAALVIATFLQKGRSVISVPLFTRMMETSEYGEYSVFVSWLEVIAIFSTICLSKGVYNNGLMKYENDREKFTFSLCVLSTVSTLIVMAVVISINAIIPNLFGFKPYMIVAMAIVLWSEPAYNMWRVRQRFEYKYRMQTLVSCSLAVLSTLAGVLAVRFSLGNGTSVFARICGYYGIVSVFQITFYILHAIRAKGSIDYRYWKYALEFNLPLIPHYLSLYVLNHFDRIMINSFLGSSSAAIYTLAYQLGSVASILWTSINASLIPYTYERCRRHEYSKLNSVTELILACYAGVCLLVILFAPEAMTLLAPASYGGATNLGGVFCSSLYYVFANVVYYYEKPKYVMIASIVSATLNLILNFVFIPRFGIVAAAYSTIACYVVQAMIDCWAMQTVVKERVYNLSKIVLIAFIMIVVSLSAQYIYQFITLRVSVLILLFIVVVIERQKIESLTKMVRK